MFFMHEFQEKHSCMSSKRELLMDLDYLETQEDTLECFWGAH